MATKTALVVITDGSEEMETVIPIDVLNRAGVQVTVAGLLDANAVTCSRQARIQPEVAFAQVQHQLYDAFILPGGLRGAARLVDSKELGEALKRHDEAGRIIATICAASLTFKEFGIGLGKSVTTHPLVRDEMKEANFCNYKDERVVIDGNLITSQAPGTAIEWSLVIVEKLLGKEKTDQVAKSMLIRQ